MSYKRILVPMDGGTTAPQGMAEAAKLAKESHARLMLMHVVEEQPALMAAETGVAVTPLIDDLRAAGKKTLERGARSLERAGVKPQTVLAESFGGSIAGAVVDQARRWRADLIVVGTHGRTGVNRALMGSEAELIARRSPVPVLLVPAGRRRGSSASYPPARRARQRPSR